MATKKDDINILSLTDCLHFTNGKCMFKSKCHYRHCQAAAKQLEQCDKWPNSCRNMDCPFRHSSKPSKTPKPAPQEAELVSFFWDIENVPIPKGKKPFEIVQRIRQKLVTESGLQEVDFSCYCNINTISQENQQSLSHANVRIIHVPDKKPGAADGKIMLDLDRFERVHRPPATIVLISGDIDFVGKLSDLRHRARFHVIVIHNKPAKEELKLTVNAHYAWELFTEPSQQQQQPLIGNSSEPVTNLSTDKRRVLNGQQKNVVNNNETRLPNLMDLNITVPQPESQVGDKVRQDDRRQSNDSPPSQDPPTADQNRRPTNITQSRKLPTAQPVKSQVPLNADNSLPSSPSTPKFQKHSANTIKQLNPSDGDSFSNYICADCNAQFDNGYHLAKHRSKDCDKRNSNISKNTESFPMHQTPSANFSTTGQTPNNVKYARDNKD